MIRFRLTTLAGWGRRIMARARGGRSGAVEAKLRAIAEASRHEGPTGDIGVMLREIEAGQRQGLP